MGLLFKNNAETTLSSGINNSVTTVPVTSAAVFPTPDANNVFFATIDDGSNIEVVKVTGISSNDLTVVRAQDNTSAATFGSGAKIELRLTAQVLDMGTASLTDLDGDTKIQVEESADEDKIRFDTGGSERMIIDSTGVGIGTTSPASPLHIKVGTDNNLEIEETGGDLRLLAINDARSANVRMEFAASAFQFLTGNVTIDGSITKGSGSFKIDHPLESKKDTHNLVHSFVEAPQADNIYRGVVSLENGSATINLDTVSGMTEGTYVLLNTNTQCFTSNETDWDAVKGSVTGNILTISCENAASTATVSWLVIGERHDQHMIDTDWTDENGKVIVEPLKNE